jgi:hypothetical protein
MLSHEITIDINRDSWLFFIFNKRHKTKTVLEKVF